MNTLDEILGKTPLPSTDTLINNWQTAFVWLVIGIIAFALIVLILGMKKVARGENVNKGMLPYVKWPLLFASAGFNVFFTYYVFLPAGQAVAIFSAVVMGGVNLAEAYLVRLIIATWRHDMKVVFKLALVFTIPVFIYSLMSAGSSFSTMMKKNQDTLVASQLELQSAQDRIGQAKSEIKEAEVSQQNGNILSALYQTEVRNSRGIKVNFNKIKNSCDLGGYYARNYPELCQQYVNFRDGRHTAQTVASANTQALATSASEKLKMAKIIKDRPPEITPTLLGFSLGIAMVGFIVSLALESAIIGVGFFEELFIKPTPLPAIVNFMNKSLDWDADTITQRGLQVDIAPSPGVVNFAKNGEMVSPFSSVGWSPQNPHASVHASLPLSSKNTPSVSVPTVPATVQKTVPVHETHETIHERSDTSGETNDRVTSENKGLHAHETSEINHETDDTSVRQSRDKLKMIRAIVERFEKAKNAKVGDMIECALCGTETKKRIDTKRFCSTKCRYDYRNLTKKGE